MRRATLAGQVVGSKLGGEFGMGGFGTGLFAGIFFVLAVATGTAIVLPLEQSDPVNKTQVDLSTPSASGFNAGLAQPDPVLPEADTAVVTEPTEQPVFDTISPALPLAGTDTAAQPETVEEIFMPMTTDTGERIALTTPGSEGSPTVPSPELNTPLSLPDTVDIQIPQTPAPIVDDPVTEIEPLPENPIAEPQAPETNTPDTDIGQEESVDTQLPQIADEPSEGANEGGGTNLASDENAPEANSEEIADNAGEASPDATPTNALADNLVPFTTDDDKPLLSVVLLDVGLEGLDVLTLATFNFPLTFAFDLSLEGASDRARYLRAAGFEVVIMTPADLAIVQGEAGQQSFAEFLGNVPESVAVIDNPAGQFQANATLTERVVLAAQSSGHALITYDQGLNSAQRAANQAGVKGVTVFRQLDGDNEPSVVIQRYLDRAAFKAGQDGGVVMFGRTYAETVKGLFSWERSHRARSVTFAPVSAVIMQPGL
jgi:polysaccharide deacetylase 2 family uncharacterized protein YibQ